jgi:hypothetical protein
MALNIRHLTKTAMAEGEVMKRSSTTGPDSMHKGGPESNDLQPKYTFDYSKAVRGKYYRRLIREGANVAVLEPDVAAAFRDSAAVNDALRSLLQVSETTRRLTRRSRPTRKERGAHRQCVRRLVVAARNDAWYDTRR